MTLILSGTDGLSDIDGTASTPAIRGTDANTGIFFPAADTIAFSEGGAEAMRINSSGDVGIGSSVIRSRLTVSDGAVNTAGEAVYQAYIAGTSRTPTSDVTAMLTIQSTNALAANVGGSIAFGGRAVSGSDAGANWATIAGFKENATTSQFGGYIQFATRPNAGAMSERARISSDGNLRVGMQDYAAQPSSTNFGVSINNTSTGSRFFGQGTGTETQIEFGNTNGTRGSIQTNSTNTLYNTTSDYRLKENVVPMVNALATVSALKPCTYTWKVNGSAGQGFIAHELAEVVPDCVTGEKDAIDEDGNIKPQFVDTSFLVATLTAAIQEQQQMIETLQAKVAALEAKG